MPLNPQSAKSNVDSYLNKSEVDKSRSYPFFFTKIELNVFRHIRGLSLEFCHPITVISGSNCSGKTSVLLAIACSHYNFDRPNVSTGQWERATWSHVVRFTNHDQMTEDWEYRIYHREGTALRGPIRGYKKMTSKKWGGVGKKEGQIGHSTSHHNQGGRHVCLIDLNRINPSRHLGPSAYNNAKNACTSNISETDLLTYMSYIFERNYTVENIISLADSFIYKFSTQSQCSYSSFNSASGEDVLVNLLLQILHMPQKSLILIDELEIGLHPKIQRRLMDVLYILSVNRQLQFIITSHSYAIIDSVPTASRLFIENNAGSFSTRIGLSTYETLTRMDSVSFPVVIVYVEDELSKKIVDKAISELNNVNPGFGRLVRVVIVGSANETYSYFKTRRKVRHEESMFSNAACILDGDMKEQKNNNSTLKYPAEEGLFFHYTNDAPEKMLVKSYLNSYAHPEMEYHVNMTNPHTLFDKMVEHGLFSSKSEAFDACFSCYKSSPGGSIHFQNLKDFLLGLICI